MITKDRASKLKISTYYRLINDKEESIVYCYKNPDFQDGNVIGFGFNIADGGGWIPAWDIKTETIIIELSLVDVNTI